MPTVWVNLIVREGRIVIPSKLVTGLGLGTGMAEVVLYYAGRVIRFRALLVVREGTGYITIPDAIRRELGIGDGVAVRVIEVEPAQA